MDGFKDEEFLEIMKANEELGAKCAELQAENERLRKVVADQAVGWKAILKLGVLEEREEWAAVGMVKVCEAALEGGAK